MRRRTERQRFGLLVPVKTYAEAKTRLTLADRETHRRLVRAFADDVLDAALASPSVALVRVVSTDGSLARPGIVVVPDEGGGDLNRALTAAARRLALDEPSLGIAAICADLPCLLAADLTAALGYDGGGRWFIPDAEGKGTSLLAAAPGVELEPRFGPGSAAEHEASGAHPVGLELVSLRLDVDTPADLLRARQVGVGTHTAEVVTTRG
ncbi:MAG: 2-phospho-L-lactate guanylyltransferase [Actinomycetota bacterium]|nr:2-phospho-L-lactate guanylyltransferase [Actinomycetota bacterium]